MRVICIDANNKPAKISSDEWIEEGVIYTVISAVNMGLQPGRVGFKLKEVTLTQKSFPYEYYDAGRFLPTEEVKAEKEKVEEAELDLV